MFLKQHLIVTSGQMFYFQERRKQQALCKACILKRFQINLFLLVLQTFFNRRTLKRTLDTRRPLQEHSQGTWALGRSKHLGTRALETLRYSKGTWTLRHSCTLIRHFIQQTCNMAVGRSIRKTINFYKKYEIKSILPNKLPQ